MDSKEFLMTVAVVVVAMFLYNAVVRRLPIVGTYA